MESLAYDFNSEKLEVIQLLLNSDNPCLVKKIKEILLEKTISSITTEEFQQRINESEEAIESGEVMSLEEFKDDLKNW